MVNVFIDESGTHKESGFMTMVGVFVSEKNVHILNDKIVEVENLLEIDSFHWSRHKWSIRREFILRIINLSISRDTKIIITIKQCPFDFAFLNEAIRLMMENSLSKIVRDGEKSFSDAIAGLFRYHFDNPEDTKSSKLIDLLKQRINIKQYLL